MMNGQEKSDTGIVAVKPTKKARKPLAESVEPRPLPDANAARHRMLRTQGRARMPKSLDRVRQAASVRFAVNHPR